MTAQLWNRRRLLQAAGTGFVITAAGCSGGDGGDGETTTRATDEGTTRATTTATTTQELRKMHTLETEGTETVAVWLYGIQQKAWRKHGIDLSVEIAPFPKKSRAVVADLAEMGTMSLPQVPSFVEEGENLTMLGTKQNLYNQVFVKDDADIERITDLAGKRLAIPPETSTTTNVVKAMVDDQFDFDLMTDTESTHAAGPPTLLPLLKNDDVDAVLLFSGDTISATVDENLRSIFNPYDIWLDATGHPPPVSNFTTKVPWLAENSEAAANFLAGWEEAVTLFKENVTEAITNYGRLGGVSTEAEAELIKQWLADDVIVGPFEFTADAMENQWQMLEIIANLGTSTFDLPNKEAVFTTTEELQSML